MLKNKRLYKKKIRKLLRLKKIELNETTLFYIIEIIMKIFKFLVLIFIFRIIFKKTKKIKNINK